MAVGITALFHPTKYFGQYKSPVIDEMITRGQKLLSDDSDYLDKNSHPSGRYDIGTVNLEKSHGPYLFTDKGEYFDATFSWMTDILDPEKHEELTNPNYIFAIGRLAQEDRTPTEDKTAVQAAFVDMMRGFWKDVYKVLPVSAGGLATDDAMQLAVGQVADKLGKTPQEMKGVAFAAAFHGRYGFGAEGTSNIDKVGHLHNGKMTHVSAPIVQFDAEGNIDADATKTVFEQSMKEADACLSDAVHAFVVIEFPLQAEGGARIVNTNTLPTLREMCQKYGKLLVVDCVQMGGRAWTMEADFVSPFAPEVLECADIITFGKIFHVNGTLVRDLAKLNRGFTENWVDKFGPRCLGGTWTGHMSQMATGYAIVQTILKKKLYLNAIEKAQYILAGMKTLMRKYPKLLTNARGRADTCYIAWTFATPDLRDNFKKIMIENEHLIFLTAGADSIRLAPFADMTNEEADALLTAIGNQLAGM